MKLYSYKKCLLLSAIIAAPIALADGLFTPKVGGGWEMANVKQAKIVQTGAVPLVLVTANGSQYDTVGVQGFAVNYQIDAVCKGLWDLHWLKADFGNKNNNYIGEPRGEDPKEMFSHVLLPFNVDSGKRKMQIQGTFGQVAVPKDIAVDAIKHCNISVDKRMQQTGQSRSKVMTQEHTIKHTARSYSPARLEMWLLCGKDSAIKQNPPFSRGAQNAKIDYRCKAKPYALPGGQSNNNPGALKTLASVQSIALSKPIPSGNVAVSCPTTVNLSASITVTGGNNVPVKYRWRRSGGYVSEILSGTSGKIVNTELLSTSHQFTVGDNKKLNNSKGLKKGLHIANKGQANTHAGWVQLEVLDPTKKASLKQPYSVKCKVKKPDLVVSQLIVAGKMPQQGSIELHSSHALSKNANGCSFPVSYQIGNKGGADVLTAFSNRFTAGSQNIGADTAPAFNGPVSQSLSTTIQLKDGLHAVSLALDSPSKIAESDEGNNSAAVRVAVTGCGS